MYKKISYFLATFYALNIYATEINTFKELETALTNGKKVRLVTRLDKCQGKLDYNENTLFTATLKPNAFMMTFQFISTSDLHFTRNNPQFQNKSVFEFITYTFDRQNKLTLTTQTLDAINYFPLNNPTNLICTMGNSVRVFE